MNVKKLDIRNTLVRYGVLIIKVHCVIFLVTHQFPHDPMHVLLEGIVSYVTALFLKHSVVDLEVLSLHALNERIRSFEYCYQDRSHRPQLTDRQDLVSSTYLKQKAVAMLILMNVFPYMIG